MNHLALLSESASNSKAAKYQQVTLEAELAGAAAREGGGARGGGEARAAEERHGVRRGRHHAGAPASSGQLPLSLRRLAEAASFSASPFFRSLALSLLWRAMRPKWNGYCARAPAALSRCVVRAHVAGCWALIGRAPILKIHVDGLSFPGLILIF